MSIEFTSLCTESKQMGERRDCAVKALALVCGVPYTVAHATAAAHGRKPRSGTNRLITFAAIKALGYGVEKIKIPHGAKTMKTLPAAMVRAGFGKGRFLVFVRDHVAAFVDGRVEDWTNNRKHRIEEIYAVVPAGCPAPAPKAPAPKPTNPPGVGFTVTRPYLAGQVIRRHGLAAGVTASMVVELDLAYGKPNPRESLFCLKNAWHAIRGAEDTK